MAAGIPILLHLIARRQPPTVTFPAVRYLVDTTREHRRRLKLQHWLLLVLRTLLVVALVLAAAAPTVRLTGVPGHAPSALVLVLDNSPSSGAMSGGTRRLDELKAAARAVLARATAEDALWLVAADAVPRRGDAASLSRMVDRLSVSPRRLELGRAIGLADEILAAESRPGEIIVVSDLQATAVSAAQPSAPLTVARPAAAPAPNAGVAALSVGPQPWLAGAERVTVQLVGDSGRAVPVTVRAGGRSSQPALASVGGIAAVALPELPSGWWAVAAELTPDEFRFDDRRVVPARVAPPARVTWDNEGRHLAAAARVLAENGRIVRGDGITFGRLGPAASVVQPPEDPAALGALNRALARRGVAWSYGRLVEGASVTDSGPLVTGARVQRRYTLEPRGSGRVGVLATVAGAPWIVRSGDVVLLGSRLEPEWTSLPVSAEFIPFVDVLLNRVARGEVVLVEGAPGDPVPLPDLVTEVRHEDRRWRVEGGARFRPPSAGVYFLLTGSDTVGALGVNPDPRESQLVPASDEQIREAWPGAWIVDLDDAGSAAFSSAARGDLRGPLLWTALALGLAEVGLASAWRRRS